MFSRSILECNINQPTTLVVQDVGTDLANLFRSTVTIEVVVLDLEVFSHRDEDVEGFLEGRGRSHTGHVEGEGDGEVEGVVCSLVDDDEVVSEYSEDRVSEGERAWPVKEHEGTYFSRENLLRSTESSGAVMRSMS